MIHHALLLLTRFQYRGKLRRFLQSLKSPKKVVPIIAVVLWFGLIMLPQIAMVGKAPRGDPEVVRLVVSCLLLAMFLLGFLTSAGENVIVFNLAEIDYLFAGPFTRRELVIYRLIKACMSCLFTALFVSLVMLQHATHWIASFIGVFLGFMMLQLVGMIFLFITTDCR